MENDGTTHQSPTEHTINYKKGSFFQRLVAFVIDGIIIFLIAFVLSVVLKSLPNLNLLYGIVAVIYNATFLWKTGGISMFSHE